MEQAIFPTYKQTLKDIVRGIIHFHTLDNQRAWKENPKLINQGLSQKQQMIPQIHTSQLKAGSCLSHLEADELAEEDGNSETVDEA